MFGITSFSQSPFSTLGGSIFLKTITESVDPTDSFGSTLIIPVSVNESIAAGDAAVSVQALAAAILESNAATDSLANTMIALAALNESAAAGDSYTEIAGKFVYITEAVAATVSQGAGGSAYNTSVQETTNADAFDSTGNIITVNVTENAVSADATQTAQLTLNQLVNESTTAGDVYAAIAQLVATINESTPAHATQAGNFVAYVNISESAGIADDPNAGNQIDVLLTETVTPAANLAPVFNYIVDVVETTGIADNITYTVDTSGIVTGVLLTISLSSPLVWEQINDDQSPNWVEIKD